MSTLGAIRAQLANQIGNYDLGDQYDHAIRAAIELHEGERFAFNGARLRLDTVAAQEFYTLPGDLKTPAGAALAAGEDVLEIESATLRWNATGTPMEATTFDELEECNSTGIIGQPLYYAREGSSFRLGPIPDAVYTIYINGLKKLGTLSAGTDTNAWMTDGALLVIASAKAILARDVLRNGELSGTAMEQERQALAALRRKLTAAAPHRIKAWGY